MSLRRLFSHHSHSGHQHSRHPNSDSSENFRRAFSAEHHEDSNRHLDETNEQCDIVEPFMPGNTAAYTTEQLPYRARRRSSVQILDKKFIQSFSNQTTSSLTNDNDFNAAGNTSEDLCEL